MAVGVFTGLIPGIHVNTVIVIVLAMSGALLEIFGHQALIAFIVAMALTHTFLDFIPSILLGAPTEDNVLSVLPGHRLLLDGRGYEAIRLTSIGGVGTILLASLSLPLLLVLIPILYSGIKAYLPYILMLVLFFIVFSENNNRKRFYTAVLVIYSGIFGQLVLESNILNPQVVLFPVLTGLFGISTLLFSLNLNSTIPPQWFEVHKGWYFRGIIGGTLGGILAGVLPAVGSSQSAVLIQQAMKNENDERDFLVALGGVNTSDSIIAILALYIIGNPRSGASIAVEKLVPQMDTGGLLLILGTVLFSTFFAVFLTLNIAKIMILQIERIDYSRLTRGILVFLVILIVAFSGFTGLVIAAVGTSMGIMAHASGVRKSSLMAVLIVPTIIYFL